ncbi:MAG: alpha-glucosidase [Bacteroidetes bacterium]|nr:alpha-glucosidase [Bacteroidota bacterium]
MKIVLFGAGSAQFGYGMLGDMFQSEILAGSEITLMDINSEALGKVYNTAREYIKTNNLPFTVSATTDRKKALEEADHVLISIEIGDRFALWEEDWSVPQQYGIRQVYGENGGPGGLFHALRIIPPILEICGDAVEICPDAHIFCYSNPMTAITTAVYRKFPGIKFYGMCHEVASLERYLPSILDTSFSNLELRSAGLNHFGVLVEAKYKDTGKDAYPDILRKAPDFFEKEPGYSSVWEYVQRTGKIPETEGSRERFLEAGTAIKPWADRGLFKVILENFNLFPITVDSHLGEYIPWAYDAVDHKGIVDFFAFYKHALANINPVITRERQERAVYMIEGMITDSRYEEVAVNIPNKGFIPGLPEDAVVEVPAMVDASGVTGIAFPDYPKAFGALLRNYTGVYDLTADAVLTGDKELVKQAILVNPLVTEWRRVEELVDVMLDKQKKWLGYIR